MTIRQTTMAMAIAIMFCATASVAQNTTVNQGRVKIGGNNSPNADQRQKIQSNRQKINAEYVKLARERWKLFECEKPILPPDHDDKPVVPIKMSEDEAKKERQDHQIVINQVVRPVINKQKSQPVAPIDEIPEAAPQFLSFTYLGQSCKVRKPSGTPVKLKGISENAVADAWEALCSEHYNNLVLDCIKLRNQLKLCDWAYLMMLQDMSAACCGNGTNEATLLMAFVYSQSGYRMRLGQANGHLEMLYATQHAIYNRSYFPFDGERFYPLNAKANSISICAAKYPKEQSMSLWVPQLPQVPFQPAQQRTLTSKRYSDVSVKVSENKNLMKFFDSYPTSEVGGNFMTRWAMYANTPVCKEVRDELYPQLKRAITGVSEKMAVEKLLNWVQTAFVYEYDDKVWGGDRAFFPDETLYYPYCDCEDRSILFTRLVRDLLGLKCILIYYPGHVATAVCLSEQIQGDYIQTGGRRFTVCDPTYIGASAGRTMPKMDNASAKVILLE
jgi:hypothetical protein